MQVSINGLVPSWDISALEGQSNRWVCGAVQLTNTQLRGLKVKDSRMGGSFLHNYRKISGLTCRELV